MGRLLRGPDSAGHGVPVKISTTSSENGAQRPARVSTLGLRAGDLVEKTCDTIETTGGRRMLDTVHHEGLRCDGAAHGGHQAGRLFSWNEAWLKRIDDGLTDPTGVDRPASAGCDLTSLLAPPRVTGTGGLDRFVRQTTELLTEPGGHRRDVEPHREESRPLVRRPDGHVLRSRVFSASPGRANHRGEEWPDARAPERLHHARGRRLSCARMMPQYWHETRLERVE